MLYLAVVLFAADPLPPLEDLHRFPSADACTFAIRANIARWDHARHRLVLESHRADHWRREIIRADQAIEAWHALLVAHGALAVRWLRRLVETTRRRHGAKGWRGYERSSAMDGTSLAGFRDRHFCPSGVGS